MQMFRALWQYRRFITSAIKNEFRGRYANSVLGGFWAILEPLSLIFVFTMVFSQVMGARLPGYVDPWSYSIYLCAGLICWNYFVEVLTRSQTMFLEHASLIKKMQFPKSALPVIVLGSSTLHFIVIFSLFLIFLALIGRFPGAGLLWLVPLLVIQQGLAIGLGLICGTLNVFFRDVGKAVGVGTMFWFWLTPIVYPASIVPEQAAQTLFRLNPMAPLVGAYQSLALSGQLSMSIEQFWPQALVALLLLLGGFQLFMKLEGNMVDDL